MQRFMHAATLRAALVMVHCNLASQSKAFWLRVARDTSVTQALRGRHIMQPMKAVLCMVSLAAAEAFVLPPCAGAGSFLTPAVPRAGILYAGGAGAHPCALRTARASGETRHRARQVGLKMQTGEKSASQQIIVGILAFGFLFGALFPLVNNGLRTGLAGDEMSGAATGMKEKELNERLSKVPAFAVTDDAGKPYVAEVEGKNKGYFFLSPDDADAFAARVKELQQGSASVGVRPTTLDAAIKYVKTSQNNPDPFEIVPIGEQVRLAEAIKSPDTCDICWGSEGVKKKVPVFWVEGLGLASEDDSKVQTPVFFDKNDAERFWRQINKDKVR